jgi:hypothetical protein
MASFLSNIFQYCTLMDESEKEMIGTWITSDEAKLSLHKDKTFTLRGFNPTYWKLENISSKIYGTGEWEIEHRKGKWFLHLSFIEFMGQTDSIYHGGLKKYVVKKKVIL